MRDSQKAKRIVAVTRHLHQIAERELIELTRVADAAQLKMNSVVAALNGDSPTLPSLADHYAARLGELVSESLRTQEQRAQSARKLATAKHRLEIAERRLDEAAEKEARADFEKSLLESHSVTAAMDSPASGKPARR